MCSRRRVLLVATLCVSTTVAHAQHAAIPVRDISTPDARSASRFGTILGVRQLAGGKLLVNDGTRRQLLLLDSALGNPSIVLDSVAVGGTSYGPRAAPIIPFYGDSTLFVDGASLSLLVIDPNGRTVRVMSAPKPSDLRYLAGGTSGVDARNNLVYRGGLQVNRGGVANGAPVQLPDSAPIVRANFDTRQVDTIGQARIDNGTRTKVTTDANGRLTPVTTINPAPIYDDWTVLSDGTIAFVRGQDYHVDWIRPDGSRFSSPKMPFDWRRLTDDDKQKLIDSARTARERSGLNSSGATGATGATGASAGNGGITAVRSATVGGGVGGGVTIGGGGPSSTSFAFNDAKVVFVPLSEMPDYYPALRAGAAKADVDGNLWILPTTSAQSKAGELVYDVVNSTGTLFQRVRLPRGRSIAGFGRGGVVYLMYKDGDAGWAIERVKVSM
ncbi:MAG TPA: hypothetical protein VE869_12055 [Gemmatimonas sp.]|nr:hypothetical protein [Gemmatimonas sp.]